MKEITAYKISDGRLFEDECKAYAAQEDLIGEELDGLLKLFELDITRTQEHKALLKVLNKKAVLIKQLDKLLQHLTYKD